MGIPADDQQAHAMSHPAAEQAGRRHVSDGAAATVEDPEGWEDLAKGLGFVLMTVAEHEELLRQTGWESIARWNKAECERFERENQALRAEVERLTAKFAKADRTWFSRLQELHSEIERLRKVQKQAAEYSMQALWYRDKWQEERLQKEREDERSVAAGISDGASGRSNARVCSVPLVVAGNLDPRLGVQQPAGEAVQPLPYWRRRMVD